MEVQEIKKLITFAAVVFVGLSVLASNAFSITVNEAVAAAAEGAKAQGMEILWEYVSPTAGVLIHRNPSTMRGCVVRFAYDGRSVTLGDTWYDVLDETTVARFRTAYEVREQLYNATSTLEAGDQAWREKSGYYAKRRKELRQHWERVELVKVCTEGMSEKEIKKWLERVWKESYGRYSSDWRPDKKRWVGGYLKMSPDDRAERMAKDKDVNIVWPKGWDKTAVEKRKAESWQEQVKTRVEAVKDYTEGMFEEELEAWLLAVYKASYISHDAISPDEVRDQVKALMEMSPDECAKALACCPLIRIIPPLTPEEAGKRTIGQ